MKPGEEYEVDIVETKGKNGIAIFKDFKILVPNTKKGDMPRIIIKEVEGKTAKGEVIKRTNEIITEEGLASDVAQLEYGED